MATAVRTPLSASAGLKPRATSAARASEAGVGARAAAGARVAALGAEPYSKSLLLC